MHNLAEKRIWPPFIPERFRIHKDISAKNLDEFLEIVAKKHPNEINISIVEKAKTIDSSRAAIGIVDHYEMATLFSFSLDSKSLSIARYIENYPESAIPANNGNPDIEKLGEMKIRAVVTAMSRRIRINTRFPLIKTQLNLIGPNGDLTVDAPMLNFIQKEAQRLRLSPFII
jgi:hypothetical protein